MEADKNIEKTTIDHEKKNLLRKNLILGGSVVKGIDE